MDSLIIEEAVRYSTYMYVFDMYRMHCVLNQIVWVATERVRYGGPVGHAHKQWLKSKHADLVSSFLGWGGGGEEIKWHRHARPRSPA